MSDDLYIRSEPKQDFRLGRIVVHDPRSRAFPTRITIDRSTWRNKRVRIYDPRTNPNQCHGECTGCAKAMEFNALGNSRRDHVMTLDDAHKIYSTATTLDPWEGSWPPDDTGSSGLAAAKAAVQLGYGGQYRHVFGGADEIVQLIHGDDNERPRVVNVGTWWHWNMFDPDPDGRVHVSGGYAGGHMWIARGYDADRDWVLGRCWWGGYRDFWIARADLDNLMRDDGDAHIQDFV